MPCRRIAPTVDAIAADFDGRATIGKMNVDDNPRTPAQYQHARHPDAAHLQGRPGRGSVVGSQVTREQLASHHREALVMNATRAGRHHRLRAGRADGGAVRRPRQPQSARDRGLSRPAGS